MTNVYRAPMRSRSDDVDPQCTVDRALSRGLCGFGERGHGDQLARRVRRFAQAPEDSFVWTRDQNGLYWLGRLGGPYRLDEGGRATDLVHVRPCRWLDAPIIESRCPSAVVETFRRGGRNFQQIHDDAVGPQTLRLWAGG